MKYNYSLIFIILIFLKQLINYSNPLLKARNLLLRNVKIWITAFIFIFSGGMAIFVALLTVSYQVVKVSLSNPVEVLKYE